MPQKGAQSSDLCKRSAPASRRRCLPGRTPVLQSSSDLGRRNVAAPRGVMRILRIARWVADGGRGPPIPYADNTSTSMASLPRPRPTPVVQSYPRTEGAEPPSGCCPAPRRVVGEGTVVDLVSGAFRLDRAELVPKWAFARRAREDYPQVNEGVS